MLLKEHNGIREHLHDHEVLAVVMKNGGEVVEEAGANLRLNISCGLGFLHNQRSKRQVRGDQIWLQNRQKLS